MKWIKSWNFLKENGLGRAGFVWRELTVVLFSSKVRKLCGFY